LEYKLGGGRRGKDKYDYDIVEPYQHIWYSN